MMNKMGKVAVGTALILGASIAFCSASAFPSADVKENCAKSVVVTMPEIPEVPTKDTSVITTIESVPVDLISETEVELEYETVKMEGVKEALPMLLDKSVNWIGTQIYMENDINITSLTSLQAVPIAALECGDYQEVWDTNPMEGVFLLSQENMSKAMYDLYGREYSVEDYIASAQQDLNVAVVGDQIQYTFGEWGEVIPKMDIVSIENVDGVYTVKTEVYFYHTEAKVVESVKVPAVFCITENADSLYGYVISDMNVQFDF